MTWRERLLGRRVSSPANEGARGDDAGNAVRGGNEPPQPGWILQPGQVLVGTDAQAASAGVIGSNEADSVVALPDEVSPVAFFPDLPDPSAAQNPNQAVPQPALQAKGASPQIALLRGIKQLTDAVKVTFGPKGKNVVVTNKAGKPFVTRDCLAIAAQIDSGSALEDMGIRMLRDAAERVRAATGEAATTTMIFAHAIFAASVRALTDGANPTLLKQGIEEAISIIVEELVSFAQPVKSQAMIAAIGSLAAKGDEMAGEVIGAAMNKVGKEGVITIEEGQKVTTELEIGEGERFDRGYLSPHFVTDPEHMECVLEDAYLFIHEKKIAAMKDLLPVVEQIARTGRPVIFVAEEFDGEALAALVENKSRGTLQCVAVEAPGFGDRRRAMLEDIAILTGGKVIGEEIGVTLETVTLNDLGRARRIVVDRATTTIVGGAAKQADVEDRIRQIRAQIEGATSDHDRNKLMERFAKVVGGVAIIKIGGSSEAEIKERKARVEVALRATCAALEEGVLPGAGIALVRAAQRLDGLRLDGDARIAVKIVRDACEEPIRQIATNAGYDGTLVLREVLKKTKPSWGFNVATDEYEDLVRALVVDPTKATRVAVLTASAVSVQMLTTGAAVVGA
ncbi:MAG: chaperonin GroEL [Deltaproteobacteria bacterium]|nr:chaperonin GroEL [Deltaproteobacteria bacterium]